MRWGSHVVRGAGLGPCGGGSPWHCALGSWSRIGCSRLADNQIGDAGVEALARALPPSLRMLYLSSTCGLRFCAVALGLGMWCSAGRMWCVVLGFVPFVAADRFRPRDGAERALRIGSVVVEARLLAACGLQETLSEMLVWRRWRAHCHHV